MWCKRAPMLSSFVPFLVNSPCKASIEANDLQTNTIITKNVMVLMMVLVLIDWAQINSTGK